MNINKQTVKMFRNDFENTVKSLEQKYGMKIQLGSISYSQFEFHSRMTCSKLSENGEKKVDEDFFNVMKDYLGFDGNLGDTYKGVDGLTYTVVELDNKKRKYPVILKCSDGKQYKSSVARANLMLKTCKV